MNYLDFFVAVVRDMNAPFAFAVAVLAAAISVPMIVRTVNRRFAERDRIQAKANLDLRRIEVSVKNGSVPTRIETDE